MKPQVASSMKKDKTQKRGIGCGGPRQRQGGQRKPFPVDEVSDAAAGIHGGQTLQVEEQQCKGSKTRTILCVWGMAQGSLGLFGAQ